MATILNGHMSKLEAVNELLWSIGEREVQSLSSGLADAAAAESILDRVNRDVQAVGWHVNTLRNYKITRDSNNQFVLGVDTLKVDTVNPVSGRQEDTPPHVGFYDVVMRRSTDDTQWVLFDVDNNRDTWPNDEELTVDLVQLIEFANLTPALQRYVVTAAGHRYQKGAMSSQVLFEFTKEDVDEARAQALQEDLENDDTNMVQHNPHVRRVAYRFNPSFGR